MNDIEDAYIEGFLESQNQALRREHCLPTKGATESYEASNAKIESEKTDKERFRDHLERASQIVMNWPEWKQGLLDCTGTCAARKPITREEY